MRLPTLVLPLLGLGWNGPSTAGEASPSSRPLEPAAAREAFRTDAGLLVEEVAAEPLVVDPAAICFDERGALLVAEYRDYPLGPEAGGKPLSRIKRLTDADGDGRFDTATVFADAIPFAQGVLAWGGGAIVTASPDVLFLKDTDGDGTADLRRVLFTGFKAGNPQLRASFPRYGLDGWIHLSNGLSGGEVTRPGGGAKIPLQRADFRFRPLDGSFDWPFEAITGHGQFGNTEDDFGRRYFCSNRNPVMHALLPAAALRRNPAAGVTSGYEDIAPTAGEAKVYPLTEGVTTALSHAGTHTAACGVLAYRGDALGPEYRGNFFVCEPTGALVVRLVPEPHGTSFRLTRRPADREFLASPDPWCRPVSLADGPDGALYVVDMCREVIEHPEYMPPGLAATLRLRAGEDRGRIWRVRRKDFGVAAFVPPETTADLLALLEASNGWRRDLGRRLLVERQVPEAVEPLRKLLRNSTRPEVQAAALGTLHGLKALSNADRQAALTAPAAEVREVMLRLLGEEETLAPELRPVLAACLADPAPKTRLNAILAWRPDPAVRDDSAALAGAFGRLDEDPWLARGVALAAGPEPAALLAAGAGTPGEWGPVRLGLLGRLAESICTGGDPAKAVEVLETASLRTELPLIVRGTILAGAANGLARAREPLGRVALNDLLGVISSKPQAEPGERSRLARRMFGEDPAGNDRARRWRQKTIELLREAETACLTSKKPAAERVALLPLLEFSGRNTGGELYAKLLSPIEPAAVQSACVEPLTRKGNSVRGLRLVEAWRGLAPPVKAAAVDAWIARTDGVELLLTAIDQGKIPASVVPLEQRERLLRIKDARVAPLVLKVFGGMGLRNRQEVFDKYLPALKEAGDVERGEAVFRRACIACHRVRNLGETVGPDLTDVRNKSKETLLSDILDPNRAAEPRFFNYVVETVDGRVLTGLVAAQTEQAIVLRRGGGQQDEIPRGDIDVFESTDKSLMPEGLETALTPADLADLLAFLKGRK